MTIERDVAQAMATVVKAATAPILADVKALQAAIGSWELRWNDVPAMRERIAVLEVRALVSGPAGERGENGRDGAAGLSIKGDPGPRGERGETGLSLKGDPGPRGEKGELGLSGKDGAAGLSTKGDPGERGDIGPRGEKGEPGLSIKGDPGERGFIGERGLFGPAGEPGAPGQRGEKGADGLQGKDGATGPSGRDVDEAFVKDCRERFNSVAPLTARVTSLEARLDVPDLDPDEVVASIDVLLRKELAILETAAPRRLQKRVIYNEHGKVDRVVEEAAP